MQLFASNYAFFFVTLVALHINICSSFSQRKAIVLLRCFKSSSVQLYLREKDALAWSISSNGGRWTASFGWTFPFL